ncbi:methylated-DNA--cysteine S-met [Phellopilus nigrolimitatus]|nr:methylated-DNA--cysteine S-met [Phellopilus nigrolimitatus]
MLPKCLLIIIQYWEMWLTWPWRVRKDTVHYPTNTSERETFRTKEGNKVTAHQWAVYDAALKIPCGKVTTYGGLCTLLGGGSPRSVGSALRKNPFAPRVPCHRVISSDLSLGGFFGEWGTEGNADSACRRKLEMLAREGVCFSPGTGKLEERESVLWNVKPKLS